MESNSLHVVKSISNRIKDVNKNYSLTSDSLVPLSSIPLHYSRNSLCIWKHMHLLFLKNINGNIHIHTNKCINRPYFFPVTTNLGDFSYQHKQLYLIICNDFRIFHFIGVPNLTVFSWCKFRSFPIFCYYVYMSLYISRVYQETQVQKSGTVVSSVKCSLSFHKYCRLSSKEFVLNCTLTKSVSNHKAYITGNTEGGYST